MQKGRVQQRIGFMLVAAIVALTSVPHQVYADEASSSDHYQLSEAQFSAGSLSGSCSSGYCARVSIGDAAVGESKSQSGTAATFGSITPDTPTLDVIVQSGASNLGTLTTEHTGTKEMIVKVRSYVSNGYVIQIAGDPPQYHGYTLKRLTSPTASIPGTEQFGINVVSNTTPSVGADPTQVPDDQTSFGHSSTDYGHSNRFMYANGDVIGLSSKASGETDFTISFIVNISNTTPAGNFSGDYAVVIVPIY